MAAGNGEEAVHVAASISDEALLKAAVSLKDQVVEATWRGGGQCVDPAAYAGLLGTAVTYLRSYEATGCEADLQLCSEIVDTCTVAARSCKGHVTFLCGSAGVYAVGAVVANYMDDQDHRDLFLQLFMEGSCELPVLHREAVNCQFCNEAERKKKEEAERKAKLDEIAERQKQRERELEEKERLRREALLGRNPEPARPAEPVPPTRPSEPSAAPSPGKYVPRHRRVPEAQASAPPAAAETDCWGNRDVRPPPAGDKWRGGDDCKPALGGGSRLPSSGDRWTPSRPRN